MWTARWFVQPQVARFISEVERVFAFLLKEGFALPQIDTSHPLLVRVTFLAKCLGIQLKLDEREQLVECEVYRLCNGTLPDVFRKGDDGLTWSKPLYCIVLAEGGRWPPDKKRVGGKRSSDGTYELTDSDMTITIEAIADMLKGPAARVLQDDVSVLD